MRIRWTPPAARDLEAISDYLKEQRPLYRLSTMRKLYSTIQTLKETPYIAGRDGSQKRASFSFRHAYVAVYRVHDDDVEIWRIYHTSQNRLSS